MVVSLMKSIPFVISAVPLVKNTGDIVNRNLDKCLLLVTQSRFRIGAIVSDNHLKNMNSYTRLVTNYKTQDKDYKIINPYLPDERIYLLFDSCHRSKHKACTSLNHNALSAICLPGVSEKEIRSSRYPWKSLAQIQLSITTVEWDSSFACVDHSENSK
ncbi:hypothetical protein LOD99_5243 [Oopsacas minuta]|uniref:Uncharacterized protein n=1 Tax=Oopsacas minuta TaxID=111878 RepID=A0AAV7JRY5_9METZ|nr:hypothetical protein LOD99_5243 [Oopsacas minuta]